MKVTGPSGPRPVDAARPQRSGAGFALPGAPAPASAGAAAAASAAAGVAGVSALMALQGVEDATERKRRAMRRGRGLLDGLDALRLAALEGADDAPALQRLSRAVGEAAAEVDDPGLATVLTQIDLRAAVELAKREVRRTAA
ncbi:flagellar assembly protein FliX [Brevundimonas fluminis]|jgi:hypothetical protein|uniref:flagellar assembly protein FliX n=1 Tax=Brevundimonas fluminis TaxID=2487274 RepID=UPI000F656678|nr:flagellar assembly protein FliX [Brevundimonas fluminis]